ncbi:MAG: hypothetical protein CMC32_00435 [Flavobacteriaceae bacterium]|nr:hypothetical protein [Flavobacteriaceae bacterium]
MSNFFNNLNQREKYLIITALMVLFVFMIFSISTNLVSSLNMSNKQLTKAKSDYEYVVSKVKALNQVIENSKLDIKDISYFLENDRSNIVLESEVIQDNNTLKIIFITKDLKDSIAISDEVSGKINKGLDTVEYSKIDNKSQTILFFN